MNARKRKVYPTRIPIERKKSIRWLDNLRQPTAQLADPGRCIHIDDREADIFALFGTAREAKCRFSLRTCVDRPAGRPGEPDRGQENGSRADPGQSRRGGVGQEWAALGKSTLRTSLPCSLARPSTVVTASVCGPLWVILSSSLVNTGQHRHPSRITGVGHHYMLNFRAIELLPAE